jgi:ABC-type dipeptide/oligopeptide/nickel transport systems, permease components
MKIKIMTIVSLLATMFCYIIPFLTFKDYSSINGLNLITSLYGRKELHKLYPNVQTYVFTSTSLPLLVAFLLFIITFILILYYYFKKSQAALNGALAFITVAVVSYGIQLSNSQTSVTDFFGTMLLAMKVAGGKTIYKSSDIVSQTGSGARLLVLLSFISLIFVTILKIQDRRERNRGNNIQTPWTMAVKQFKRNKLAIAGLVLISLLIIICFYGPVFSKYPLLKTDILLAKLKPGHEHLLGTDSSGRDIFTRLMYGGRISITVGFVAVLLEILLGTTIGGLAGYYSGKIDNILMRLVDVFLSLPFLPVVIIIGAVMSDLNVPPQRRIYFVMLIIGVMSWPVMARLIRGQILSLREQEYMIAAEALGLKDRRKILRHLIPNVIPSIIVSATLGIGDAILMESALSFLGLGVAVPFPSWGNMVQAVRDTNDFILRPWLWIPPGVCIFSIVLAINFMGDGLRDAFDPKMKR